MKLLASDYDGTLYFEDGYKQEDLEAIRAFQKQGNMFGLCSGRPLRNLWSLQSEALKFDFIIASSGASFATDPEHVLEERTVPLAVLEEIEERMGLENVVVVGKTRFFVQNPACWAAQNVGQNVETIHSAKQVQEPVLQISMELPSEAAARAMCAARTPRAAMQLFSKRDLYRHRGGGLLQSDRHQSRRGRVGDRGRGCCLHWRQLQRSAHDRGHRKQFFVRLCAGGRAGASRDDCFFRGGGDRVLDGRRKSWIEKRKTLESKQKKVESAGKEKKHSIFSADPL